MKYIVGIISLLYFVINVNYGYSQTSCEDAKILYNEAVSSNSLRDKIVFYTKAISLCPEYAEAHNNLADSYEKLGYIDKAEKEYIECLRYNKKLTSAIFSLGDLYYKKGNYSLAIEYYEKGLELSPNDEIALKNLNIAKGKIISNHTKKDTSSQLLVANEIIERLDPVKTMGVGGVHSGEGRIAFRNILFEFNSDTLKNESIEQMNEIGKALSSIIRQNSIRFIIEGHTDNIGRDDFNIKLSQKRAESVKKYLAKVFGIQTNNLNIVGYGKLKPIDDNGSEEGRKNNRRVEIVREK